MTALQLEILQGAGLSSLGESLRSAIRCCGQTVYTAPGLTLENPIRLAQLPADADLSVIVLSPAPEGDIKSAPPAPLATVTLPLGSLRARAGPSLEYEETLPPGSLQWIGWLALEGSAVSFPEAGDVPPQLCFRVTFEGAAAARSTAEATEPAKEEQPAAAECEAEDAPVLRSHGQTPSFSNGDPMFALETAISELSNKPSAEESTHMTQEVEATTGQETGASMCQNRDRISTVGSDMSDESIGHLPRFGSFRLSSAETAAALLEAADRAAKDVPAMKQALDLALVTAKTASFELDPGRDSARGSAKQEGIQWPAFNAVSNQPTLNVPELEVPSWQGRPLLPECDGPSRLADSTSPGKSSSNGSPARSSDATAMELCRKDSEHGLQEAEVMKTVVGHLYSRLVQAASGLMLEKWADTFSQVISDMTQGANSCKNVKMATAMDKDTEIDLSEEFPPEKRKAPVDLAKAEVKGYYYGAQGALPVNADGTISF